MAQATQRQLAQKKSLGQVFLKVDWPVERMVQRLVELKIRSIIEIGPGPGNLTQHLLDAGMAVTAIEKDFRFASLLAHQAKNFQGASGASLSIVNSDVLQFEFDTWISSAEPPCAIVGNIPYNISSPILLKTLPQLPRLAGLLFMTQLEFAHRVGAQKGTKDYGSLSVYSQLRSHITLEFEVERTLFKPVPKVDSAVFLATPRDDVPSAQILKTTEQICRAAFSQRRKMLRNSLKAFLEMTHNKPPIPIDLDQRADAISPEDYVNLAKWLLEFKNC